MFKTFKSKSRVEDVCRKRLRVKIKECKTHQLWINYIKETSTSKGNKEKGTLKIGRGTWKTVNRH